MNGMKALPADMVSWLHDRIRGSVMGGVRLTPAVDESISGLARRTTAIGSRFIAANGGTVDESGVHVQVQNVVTQSAELFSLSELTRYWNPEWSLERAGFGGAGGGMPGIRGNTYLDGDVLATYPRDEVRGTLLTRRVNLSARPKLSVDVAADPGRAWQLEIFAGNDRVLSRVISGASSEREWQSIDVSLDAYAGRPAVLRLYQRVLLAPPVLAGNAYWRNLKLQ
jgi:hypothetical protein